MKFMNNISLVLADSFLLGHEKVEQPIPFLFYRFIHFAGCWLTAESSKDLYIGENDVKKVETTRATMIQLFNSSLFFVNKDVQAAFWLRAYLSQYNT